MDINVLIKSNTFKKTTAVLTVVGSRTVSKKKIQASDSNLFNFDTPSPKNAVLRFNKH